MYHASEGNRLYDFTAGVQTDVTLKHKDRPMDIIKFLDDVSLWMDKHPRILREKYLPLSCIAVGLSPILIGAFIYGCFVGRTMEKKGVTVNTEQSIMDKKH